LTAAPRHPDALHVRGRVHHRRGELEAGERLLRQAIVRDAAVPEFHADLAGLLQDRGELDAAITAYRRALRLKPDFAEALNDLGTVYGEKTRFDAAIECYQAAIRLQPDHVVAHGNLGSAYRKLGQIAQARRALQRELLLRIRQGARRLISRRAAPTLAAHAEQALRRGNLRLAEEIARGILEEEAGNVAALRVLAASLERQGRGEDAVRATREALRLAPADADLHARLGHLLAAAGDADAAVASFEESRRLRPGSPRMLAELAELELKRGNEARAEELAQEGLASNPGKAYLHCLLGEIHNRRKNFSGAEVHYRRALDLDPLHLASWIRLSECAREAARLDEAEAYAQKALELDSESAGALFALGMVLKAKGRTKDAIGRFERALALDPQQTPIYQQLARLLREEDKIKEAEGQVRAALMRRPEDPGLLADLAFVLGDQMRYDEALAAVERALERSPQSLGALICKGLLLDQVGRGDEALGWLKAARELAPQDANTQFTVGLHRLKYHDFGAGWDGYEHRRQMGNFIGRYRRFPFPEWDGSALDGRTLLLYPEQGLGDEIMFSSCVGDIAAQARGLVIECDRKLEELFRRSFAGATVVPRYRSVANDWVTHLDPRPDVQTPLGSLPKYFRRRLEDFPRHDGYLRADPEKVDAWRGRLAGLGPGRTIGLSWQGGVGFTGRTRRSLTLENLLPLLRMPQLRFVSLQYTDVREELEAFTRRHGLRVHHWQEAIDDYDQTAALVCAVDEVITVCTAIVHLSGALGRPATVMVPYGADWRYGGHGERMPWYPSVRLVRQPALGDWTSVVQEVARRLAGASGAP
jgi:tetratricopeptide (TPR) repeat protein